MPRRKKKQEDKAEQLASLVLENNKLKKENKALKNENEELKKGNEEAQANIVFLEGEAANAKAVVRLLRRSRPKRGDDVILGALGLE